MSDMTSSTPSAPLGVGGLIGESFGLVFGNFKIMFMLAAIPTLVSLIINVAVSGVAVLNPGLAFTDPFAYLEATGGGPGTAVTIIITIIGVALWGFAAAAITKAAYEAKLGNAVSFGDCVSVGLAKVVPVALCTIVAYIVCVIAAMALVIPGLYVAGMWALIVPIIVAEGIGFAAFGRSMALTKGYRWPMVGLILLTLIVMLLVMLVAGALQFIVAGLGMVGLVVAAVLSILAGAVFYGFGASVVALAYARLREIKEGMSLNELSKVFE